MPNDGKKQAGIRNLLSYDKGIFRTPENLNHYLPACMAVSLLFKYATLNRSLMQLQEVNTSIRYRSSTRSSI